MSVELSASRFDVTGAPEKISDSYIYSGTRTGCKGNTSRKGVKRLTLRAHARTHMYARSSTSRFIQSQTHSSDSTNIQFFGEKRRFPPSETHIPAYTAV
jgi:hypothetical protein